MDGLGIVKELNPVALLEEREMRIAISVYGYAKLANSIAQMKKGTSEEVPFRFYLVRPTRFERATSTFGG